MKDGPFAMAMKGREEGGGEKGGEVKEKKKR